jgi:hypothetical protein
VSTAAPTKAKREPRYLLAVQPLTGRLWRIDPIAARVYRFEWQDKRYWREQDPETFSREAGEHALTSLQSCPVVELAAGAAGGAE